MLGVAALVLNLRPDLHVGLVRLKDVFRHVAGSWRAVNLKWLLRTHNPRCEDQVREAQRVIGMEVGKETVDLATEDIKERKQVQSQRDFEPLLDTEEAARLLRMHPRTLRTKARRGSIPAVQVGKRWRFRASTLDRWIGKLAS
jgi:excisionase family DNA binding protein